MVRISTAAKCLATNLVFASGLTLLSGLPFAPVSRAQSSLSVEQLINSLQPTAKSVANSHTRGIRRLDAQSDSTAPASSGTPATSRAPAATPDVALVSPGQPKQPADGTTQTTTASAEAPAATLYVQFQTGSATLTPPALDALDKLGKALASSTLSPYRFRIEGHTDTVGSKEYNRLLSERRAGAVVGYIEQKFGLDASRLVAVGLGSEHLLVPTPDQTPEARNRRVQVINLGA